MPMESGPQPVDNRKEFAVPKYAYDGARWRHPFSREYGAISIKKRLTRAYRTGK